MGQGERPHDRPLDDGRERALIEALVRTMRRPAAVVEQVVVGPAFVAVTAGGRMGLASLLGARPAAREAALAEGLVGQDSTRAAAFLTSASPFCISLGLAALNASNAPDPAGVPAADAPAEALIAELGRGKAVGLVGEFPFVERLRTRVGSLALFELRDVPGAVARADWDAVLAGLDVLALTGTALLTRQMAYFLRQAARAVRVVLGPSTPLARALFDCGADYLCASVVTDPGKVAEGIRAGLPFHALKRAGGIRFVQCTRPDVDNLDGETAG